MDTFSDDEIGEVKLRKSAKSKRISIRVHPVKGVSVVVPQAASYDDGLRFFMLKREWILSCMERQRQKYKERSSPDAGTIPPAGTSGFDAFVENLRAEAKRVLPGKVAFFSARFGLKYNRVAIKHNSSNWGSCSAKGNINLNLNLIRLPEILSDYVILHEMTHLVHLNHSPLFHDLLEKYCTDDVIRLAGLSKDPYLFSIVAKINASRSRHPVRTTLERELRLWHLI